MILEFYRSCIFQKKKRFCSVYLHHSVLYVFLQLEKDFSFKISWNKYRKNVLMIH